MPTEYCVHRMMTNFATQIACTAAIHTYILEMCLINNTSLIYQEKVSQQHTFPL
jgi:hypothetical protein